jgi:hypothetical protein
LPVLDNDPHEPELEQLNAALISRFISITKSDGTSPLVVYFPARVDFSEENPGSRESTLRTLRRAGVDYIDLRSCVAAAGVDNAFTPDRPHYSPAGNAAVASCLLPAVRHALAWD